MRRALVIARQSVSVLFASALLGLAHAQTKPAADLIITNAKIWTVDKTRPHAEALAVLGDRIVAVGSATEVDVWHGPQTKVLDAQGKLLLPGFNDAHVHFVDGGDHLSAVQLKDAASPDEFARKIADRVKTTAKGEWIVGGDWDELQEQGALTVRIYAAPMETSWKDQAKLGIRRAFGTAFLRMGAVKGYADGSLGSTTAYFFDPYTDAPDTHGLLSDEMHPVSAMQQRLRGADAAGLQLCVHAIGDRAISMTLDIFAQIEKTNGKRDRRWRIEHSQHMASKDFTRYARLGVIASVQPYHAIDDGRWAESRIGPDRIKRTYAFRTFLDNGVRLAFGTDWSVAPLSPMLSVYAAVTRATLDGKNPDGWVPEQKLTVTQAIEAYTMGSAYAEFQEKEKGSITPGKLADFVILSDDIFKIPPAAIKNVKVEATYLGGKLVYGGLE